MIYAALQRFDPDLLFGLQNRCTTAVLSRRRGGFPSFLRVCGQRETRRKREGDRFASSRKAAQSVPDSHHMSESRSAGTERGSIHRPKEGRMDDRADITISLQEHGRRPDPVHYTDQHLRRRSGYHGPWSDRPDDLAEAALKEAFTCLMLDPIQPPPSHLPGVPSGFKADEKVMRLLDLGIEYLCGIM